MGIIRSFVSVKVKGLPDVEKLAMEMGRIRGIKGVRPENIHLTLKFLGNIDEEHDLPAISSLLTKVSRRHEPFEIRFTGTGAFPNLNRIRVAWIGIECDSLEKLADDVLRTLPKGNNEKTQRFKPHLTIGRVKFAEGARKGRELLEKYVGRDFGTLRVETFELMKSTLTPQGPIYDVLERYWLCRSDND